MKERMTRPPTSSAQMGMGTGMGNTYTRNLGLITASAPPQREDGPRRPYRYGAGGTQEQEDEITGYSPQEVYEEESSLSDQCREERAEEVQAEHVGRDMPDISVDKQVGDQGPGAGKPRRRPEPQGEDKVFPGEFGDKKQRVYKYDYQDGVGGSLASISHKSAPICTAGRHVDGHNSLRSGQD